MRLSSSLEMGRFCKEKLFTLSSFSQIDQNLVGEPRCLTALLRTDLLRYLLLSS